MRSLLFGSLAALLAAACSGSETSAPPADAGGADGFSTRDGSAPPDGGGPTDATGDVRLIVTTFRFAQLSPDLGTADVCYRGQQGDWVGPIFATQGLEPVPFLGVGDYMQIATSGTLDVAVVAAGELSCTHAAATGQVTLDPGKRATVVAMGSAATAQDAGAGVQIAAFVDDAQSDPLHPRTRIIHAARAKPLGPIRVDLVAPPQEDQAIALDVEPGRAATPSAVPPLVDALGYSTGGPLVSSQGDVVVSTAAPDGGPAASWKTALGDVALQKGSVQTFFVADDGSGGLVLVLCTLFDTQCRQGPLAPQ